MTTHLVINRWESYCSNCRANIIRINTLTVCPECEQKFTHVTTEYVGLPDMEEYIKNLRPDLKWVSALDYDKEKAPPKRG